MTINPAYLTVTVISAAGTLLLGLHSLHNAALFLPTVLCAAVFGSHLCDSFGKTKEFGEAWLDHQFMNAVLAVKHLGHLEGH